MIQEYRNEYIIEATQVLQNLRKALLRYEWETTPENTATIHQYFHTLTESATLFGFGDVEKLSNQLEAVYSDLMDGSRPQADFIFDLTLHGIDVLFALLDENDNDNEATGIIKYIMGLRQTSKHKTCSCNTHYASVIE
jgi:chemotaxis protein histidine kinase CheA